MECWLTEEEYQEKKAERMLAWQDGTPPRQEEPLNDLSLDITVSHNYTVNIFEKIFMAFYRNHNYLRV
jgi:hypothetical protein